MVKRALKTLFALLLTYHVAALTCMSYPRSSYMGGAITRPFSNYINYTKQRQRWNMFETWDPWQRIEPEILYTDVAGEEHALGALMPGFRRGLGGVRARIFFQRTFMGSKNRRWRTYLPQVCKDLRSQLGVEARSVRVRVHFDKIRRVKDILKGGPTIETKHFDRGPVTCT